LGRGWSLPSFFVYLGMEIKEVIDLMGDKIFTVTFVKKDGTQRVMNARRGVKKGVKGVGMAYNPTEKGLITVYDMQKQAFRMVNSNTIIKIVAEGTTYTFENGQLI
jgi:hypothetical protein